MKIYVKDLVKRGYLQLTIPDKPNSPAQKFVNTAKKDLDYQKLGKELARDLKNCRKGSYSLDAFCLDLENLQ